MQGKSVNLLIPGLLKSFQSGEIDTSLDVDCFLIQKLIARSDILVPDTQGISVDYQSILPVAYFEYYGSDFVTSPSKNTLYADPVHLELKSDHILARPIITQPDDSEKLSKIVTIFNEHFSEEGLLLELTEYGRVFCQSKNFNLANMTPTSQILGRDIKHFLPKGENSSDWIRVFNETQMLLHEKLSYEERLIGGLELNSFWFWGGGLLDQNANKDINYLGTARWLKGFCKHNQSSFCSLDRITDSSANTFYLIEEKLIGASSTGDYKEWLDVLKELENEILLPLYEILLSGEIEHLIIHESSTTAYKFTKNHRYRIFRKPVSLEKICVSQK